MNMYLLFLIIVVVSISEIRSEEIQSKIDAYFASDTAKSFEKQWKKHQIPFEMTLNMALQQGYGHKTMNVYINRFQDPLSISVGYYHTDNQVHMIIQNMGMDELPHIIDADVTFPLSFNVLSFEGSVSKILVHGSYVLFRNKSDIIYSVTDQNPYESSPFRFQQVRNVGEVAISIEGCTLSGIVIASLSGSSVHLGYDQFHLTECQYNLEIYSPGTGAPPVMVPYLPKGDKHLNIEHLLMRPITEELLPKLQASMFSYVNTSAIFTNKLPAIQEKQKSIFDETNMYMNQVVSQMNSKSVEKNMGTISMGDFTIVWDDALEMIPKASTVTLSDMLLMGLDTLYSSNTGGPFRLTETEIAEQLRFSALQVIGKISVKGFQDDNEFAAEITDFAVDITIDSGFKAKFDPVGWRFLEFSCPKMEFPPVESLVVGYLLNELPKQITSHLKSVYIGRAKLELPTHDDYVDIDAGDGAHMMYEYVDRHLTNNTYIDIELELSSKEYIHQALAYQENNTENGDQKSLTDVKNKVNDEATNNEPIVKLNQLDIEPDFEDKGPIKLHNVEVEPYQSDEVPVDPPVDGSLKLNLQNDDQVKLNNIDVEPDFVEKGPIKLHNVEVEPYQSDEVPVDPPVDGSLKLNLQNDDQVKLNNIDVEPDFVEKGPIKLHNVEVEPYQSDEVPVDPPVDGSLKLNLQNGDQVKLSNIDVEPDFVEKGPIKLHNVEVEPYQSDETPIKRQNKIAKPHVKHDKAVRLQRTKAVTAKGSAVKKSNQKQSKPKALRSKTSQERQKLQSAQVKKRVIFSKKHNKLTSIKRSKKRLNQTSDKYHPTKSTHVSDNKIH